MAVAIPIAVTDSISRRCTITLNGLSNGALSNQLQAMIVLDVTDVQGDLLSGNYRVETSGVTSWISGQWELPLSLSGK